MLLPGAPQFPLPFLSLSASDISGENKLHSPAVVCSSLFQLVLLLSLLMTQGAQSEAILASNPNLLSLDSQKSLDLYYQGGLSSTQRMGAVGPRLGKKTHTGTDASLYHGLLKSPTNSGLVFPRSNYLSGRRKINPLLPLSGLRPGSVYAPKEHPLYTQVVLQKYPEQGFTINRAPTLHFTPRPSESSL